MLGEVRRRVGELLLALGDVWNDVGPPRQVLLEEHAAVVIGDRRALGGVGHDHEVIAGEVAAGRCLDGDLQALSEDRRGHRTAEVEAPPHGASRGQDVIDRSEIHRVTSVNPAADVRGGRRVRPALTAKAV